MTGLGGVNAREFELFAPNLTFDDWLAAPSNGGVPGRDPYPRIERNGQLRLMEGERKLGSWTARKVDRGMMRPSGTPQDWAVEDGQWLTEELASRGRVDISLTDIRLLVVIPATRSNDQMCDRNPSYRRGDGQPVGLTITERLYVPVVAAMSRGQGSFARFIRELVGDFPPLACHLPLESIAGVSLVAKGRNRAVRIDTQLGAGTPDARPCLRLELILGEPSAVEVAGSLREAIRERWLAASLPAELRDCAGGSDRHGSESGEEGYMSPLFRPIGSSAVIVSKQMHQAGRTLPESIPVADLGLEVKPTVVDQEQDSGGYWTCSECGFTRNRTADVRCLRCRKQADADKVAG